MGKRTRDQPSLPLNGGLFPEVHRPLIVQKILMSPVGFIVGRLFNRAKLGKNFKLIFGPNSQPTEAELDDFWTLTEGNGGRYVFHLAHSLYYRTGTIQRPLGRGIARH